MSIVLFNKTPLAKRLEAAIRALTTESNETLTTESGETISFEE